MEDKSLSGRVGVHRHKFGGSSMSYLADVDRFDTLAVRMCSRARTSSHLQTKAIEVERVKLGDVQVLVELQTIGTRRSHFDTYG